MGRGEARRSGGAVDRPTAAERLATTVAAVRPPTAVPVSGPPSCDDTATLPALRPCFGGRGAALDRIAGGSAARATLPEALRLAAGG